MSQPDQSADMTPAQRAAHHAQRLQEFIPYAYENAPGVKRVFDEAGVAPADVRTVDDLTRVPVTTKDALVQLQQADPPFGGFVAVPLIKLKRIFFSPGPIYDPEGDDEDAAKSMAEAFRTAGFGPGDIVINSFSYHLVPAGLLLDGGLQYLGATVIPTGVGNTELQVKMMLDLKATGYVGTPSFLMALIKKAEEMGFDFREQFAMHKALVTGEMLPPSLRRELEEDYGINVSECYATADLGVLGYQCAERAGLHVPDEIIVEIVDRGTGQRLGPGQIGEAVVTTFNRTYPLIRFGTGDLSAYTDEPCACGRTSHRLTGLFGRVGDAVKVRGMFVHPNQVRQVMSAFPDATRYQAVVTRTEHRDNVALRVEGQADEAALRDRFREVCRVGLDSLEFVAAGAIPEDAKIVVDERTWD